MEWMPGALDTSCPCSGGGECETCAASAVDTCACGQCGTKGVRAAMPGEASIVFGARWNRPPPRSPVPVLDSADMDEVGGWYCKARDRETSLSSVRNDWGSPFDLEAMGAASGLRSPSGDFLTGDDEALLLEGDEDFVHYSRYPFEIGGFDYTLTRIGNDAEAGPAVECSCDTDTVAIDSDVRDQEYFTLDSSCGSMDEEIIFAAWSLLVDNLDLVAEAAAEYDPSRMASLQSEVLGREFFIIYYNDLITVKCQEISGVADYRRSEERMRLDDDYLMRIRFLWDSADAEGGRTQRKGQACAAADLASTILHELVHADGYGRDPADRGHSTYLIENYFRYYLMRRLCVLGWGCCNWATSTRGNYDILVGNPRFNSETHFIGSARNVCNDKGAAC